jgi:hypothetical protein
MRSVPMAPEVARELARLNQARPHAADDDPCGCIAASAPRGDTAPRSGPAS